MGQLFTGAVRLASLNQKQHDQRPKASKPVINQLAAPVNGQHQLTCIEDNFVFRFPVMSLFYFDILFFRTFFLV